MNKTVNQRVKNAVVSAFNQSKNGMSDDAYILAEVKGITAGLTMLTKIVEEQGEVINGYNEAVKTYMKEVN